MNKVSKVSQKLADYLNRDIGKVDWIIYGILAIIMCVFFQHSDIVGVAEESFLILEGHITDFYEAATKFSDGIISANYLLPTFILFAIWNIPLFLLGKQPMYWAQSGFKKIMWYKALPVLFFLLSGYIFYKILLQLGMTKRKSKIGMYLFLTMPMGMFSQYFFGQYDSFTVFFMLLGIYFYIRNKEKDWLYFIIFMAVAFTFKYYVLVIVLPLLLLREKRILRLILNGIIFLIPYAFFALLFKSDIYYQAGVGDFNATDFVSRVALGNGTESIQIIPICFAIICAWAYFKKLKNRDEEIRWAVYFCNMVCILLFGLMHWHPQWIMFAVPFWTLGILLSIHYEIYLLLEMVATFLFLAFVYNSSWADTIYPWLTGGGILGESIINHYAQIPVGNLFVLTKPSQTFSYLAAIIFIFGIFRHPRYLIKNLKEDNYKTVILVRIRFILATFLLIFPMMISIISTYTSPRVIQTTHSTVYNKINDINERQTIGQYFFAPFDVTINQVECRFYTGKVTKKSTLLIQIIDDETGEILSEESYNAREISTKEILTFPPVELKKDRAYKIMFSSEDATKKNCLRLIGTREFATINDGTPHAIVKGKGKSYNYDLIFYEGEEYIDPNETESETELFYTK